MKWWLLLIAILGAGCSAPEPDPTAEFVRHRPPPALPTEVTTRTFNTANPVIDTNDPDNWVPQGAKLAAMMKPKVLVREIFAAGYGLSPDGSSVTFKYGFDLANYSLCQIGEVDMALQFKNRFTNKVVFQSEPLKFTKFDNNRILHLGALEGYSALGRTLSAAFTVPARLWTTDVYMIPAVIRAVPVADEHDLHDIGNMIAFMQTHQTADIERALLNDPSLIKACDMEGSNARTIAMACGTPRLVRFVMERTTCPEGDGPDKFAFEYAVVRNFTGTLDYLLKRGYDVNYSGGATTTPLLMAIMTSSNVSARWLIAHGANVNPPPTGGESILGYAIRYENLDGFKMLVAAKSNIHHYDAKGLGLMHLAIIDPRFLPFVLAAGVPVDDASPSTHYTPLMAAASTNNYQAARWFLDHGADIRKRDSEGDDVFAVARKSNTLHTDRFFREGMGDLTKYYHKG